MDCVIFGDIIWSVYTAHTKHVLYNHIATTYCGSSCAVGRHIVHNPITIPIQRPSHSEGHNMLSTHQAQAHYEQREQAERNSQRL